MSGEPIKGIEGVAGGEGAHEAPRRLWPKWVTALMIIAVALCFCLFVWVVISPAVGPVMNNLIGIPNNSSD